MLNSLLKNTSVFLDIDDCATHPCKNHGTCHDGINKYTCTCPPGFSGTQCQTGTNGSDLYRTYQYKHVVYFGTGLRIFE